MMGFVVKNLRMLLFFGGSFFEGLIDNSATGEMAICLSSGRVIRCESAGSSAPDYLPYLLVIICWCVDAGIRRS